MLTHGFFFDNLVNSYCMMAPRQVSLFKEKKWKQTKAKKMSNVSWQMFDNVFCFPHFNY